MSEVKTPPVKATLFDDIDKVQAMPGAFEYYREGARFPAGMIFYCPCGCGKTGALAFRPHASPSWEWNGNLEAPVLSPSVHDVGHWHGYLGGSDGSQPGVWVSC